MELVKLLNKNYGKFTSQYQVDEYIRLLRSSIKQLKLQNDFLMKEEQYIPITVPVNYPYNNDIMFDNEIEDLDKDFIAVTITFDQKKFPQLIITPLNEQIKYIEKVFSILIYDKHITGLYGAFERQKNGYIHGHFIMPHYGDHNNLLETITPYFTNRTIKQQHAVLIKKIRKCEFVTHNIPKWFQYMNKVETFKEYIEYNLRKKTLEL